MEDKQLSAANQTTIRTEDFGFVGYRDYKGNEFFKRYEQARSEMPKAALDEIEGKKPAVIKPKAKGAVAILIFGIIYLLLSVIGYFVRIENTIVTSLLGVFDGKDLITTIMGLLGGDISDMPDMIGAGAMAVSVLLAFAAFIGGIVCAARKNGIGKAMKTGCCFWFLFITVSIVCEIIRRLDITIGISVLVILSGISAVIALKAPSKIKERM